MGNCSSNQTTDKSISRPRRIPQLTPAPRSSSCPFDPPAAEKYRVDGGIHPNSDSKAQNIQNIYQEENEKTYGKGLSPHSKALLKFHMSALSQAFRSYTRKSVLESPTKVDNRNIIQRKRTKHSRLCKSDEVILQNLEEEEKKVGGDDEQLVENFRLSIDPNTQEILGFTAIP